jgi:chromosome segregation ATPase
MAPRETGAADQERRRRRHRELLSSLKTVNAELSDLEWTLTELEQQIGSLEAEHDLLPEAALARRIRDLRRWRGVLEERVLRQMYRAEELNAEIAGTQAEREG